MPDLRVDLERMRAVGADLNRVAHEFEGADVRSDGIADATGHPGLADAVRSFAHSWNDTREEMTGGIRALGDAASAIADGFGQTDADLAAAISGEGS
ncbi:hypothetical protein ABZ477_06095 [Microbacterium sp. NPDC019599]|uniref:hypothetical protein n=1 Tax=Microbacterium sp. NPDC019599 TaxID=3154690 RepID=UPI0033E41203